MQLRVLSHEAAKISSDIAIHRSQDTLNETKLPMEIHMGGVPDATLGGGTLEIKHSQGDLLIEAGSQGLISRGDENFNESLSVADEAASNESVGEDFVGEEF
jgi:hypothetical protein